MKKDVFVDFKSWLVILQKDLVRRKLFEVLLVFLLKILIYNYRFFSFAIERWCQREKLWRKEKKDFLRHVQVKRVMSQSCIVQSASKVDVNEQTMLCASWNGNLAIGANKVFETEYFTDLKNPSYQLLMPTVQFYTNIYSQKCLKFSIVRHT